MFAIPLVLLGLRRYTALTVVMLVALAIVLPGVSGFDQRVVRSDLSQKYGPTPNSVEYRILAWGRLLHVYAQSPLVGYGLRTTELVNPSKGSATTSASGANPTGRIGANPHSSVIRPLVEGGPLLLASWIALFVVLIAGLRRLARGESEVRPYARILLVLWIAVAIAGVASGDIVGFTALMFALLALTGAVGAAFQQLRPKAATSSDAHHGAH
jgi:O-antigen ligase